MRTVSIWYVVHATISFFLRGRLLFLVVVVFIVVISGYCWLLIIGCWVGCWVDYWLLGWLLVVGCWLLVVDCLLLIVDCWLLVVGC